MKENDDAQVLEQNFLDEFEVIDSPAENNKFIVKGSLTQGELSETINMVYSLKNYYFRIIVQDEIQSKAAQVAFKIGTIGKVKFEQLSDKDYENLSSGIQSLYDTMVKSTKEDPAPEDSYRKKVLHAIIDYFEMLKNGDIQILQEAGEFNALSNYISQFGVDMPCPLFAERNEQGTVISEYYDNDKFELMMAKSKLADVLIEKINFAKNVQAPYYRAKKAGNIYPDDERKFKKETYDHLVRERSYLNVVRSLKMDDMKDMTPFYSNTAKQSLEMDWKGDRFGIPESEKINSQIAALEHGLSPEDMPVIYDIREVKKKIQSSKSLSKETKTKLTRLCNKFENTIVTTAEERKKLYDEVEPVYKALKKIDPEESQQIINNYKTARKSDVDMVSVNPDERLRQELVKEMEEFIKGLSAQHRGSVFNHSDTPEMKKLKDKAKETLSILKERRGENILDEEVQQHYKDLDTLSKAYANKKRDEAIEDIKSKGYDKEKEKQLIRDWKPDTRMGRTRLNTAKAMIVKCESRAKQIHTIKKERQELGTTIDDVRKAGFKVVHATDFLNQVDKPYKAGIAQIINNYGMDPAFVPEFCGPKDKQYKPEEFKTKVNPIYVANVTNENFALVAYAAAYNPDNLNIDFLSQRNPVKQTTNLDTYYQTRTMFTADMALLKPRTAMYESFYDGCIEPARHKAKEAFEAYNKGDKSKIIELLATGLKELQNEVINESGISTDGNFAFDTGMMAKMVDFAKTDKDLHAGVVEKLGPELREAINDTMRLKYYMDECIDAQKKLEDARDKREPLSVEEKKECIEKVSRFTFVSAFYATKLSEMIDNNQELTEFRTSPEYLQYCKNEKDDKNQVMTNQDVTNTEYKFSRAGTKVIPELNKNLRTEKGLGKFNDIVKKIASSIDPNLSEEKILKNLKEMKSQSSKELLGKNKKVDKTKDKKQDKDKTKETIKKK